MSILLKKDISLKTKKIPLINKTIITQKCIYIEIFLKLYIFLTDGYPCYSDFEREVSHEK